MPPRFSKIGSPELFFLNFFALNRVYGTNVRSNVCLTMSQELKFSQNRRFQKQVGSLELEKDLKWWVSGATKGLKRGS